MRDIISIVIEKMYILKVFGVLIWDFYKISGVLLVDQYVGFLDFVSFVFWVLEVLWLNFNFFYSFFFLLEVYLIL